MKKFLLSMLFSVLACCLSSATDPMLNNNYGTYGTVDYFDNGQYFTQFNLWHIMPAGNPQIAQFAVSRTSANALLFRGLDPQHNVWSYTESWNPYNGIWAQQTAMGTDNKVLALGFNKIYKLTNSACTTANEFTVKKWNGSAWIDPSGAQSCSAQIAVGDTDGTLGSRVLSGHVYLIDAGTTVWVQLTGGPNNFQSVALSSKNSVFVNDTTGKIWQRTPGTNTVVASSFANTPEVTGTLYTSYAGETWFRGSSGKLYIYYNNAWVHPVGGAYTNMATAGPMNTFAVVSNNLYRFTEKGMSTDAYVSGNSQCPPTGCVTGSAHSPSFSLEFASGSLGLVNGAGPSAYPSDTAMAIGTAKSYDTWSCAFSNFNSAVCFTPGARSGTVHCSILGTIYTAIIQLLTPKPPTDIVIERHEASCVQNGSVATLTTKWYNITPLGQPVCYPKPPSSWVQGSMTGNSCSTQLPWFNPVVVVDSPTGQGSTIHQKWAGATSLTMVPDCNGTIANPIWEIVGTTTSRP